MGEQSSMSRSPWLPTSTGKLPTFLHAFAASLRPSGGSKRETNSPPSTVRIVCAESSEHSRTESRSSASGGIEVAFVTSIMSLSTPSWIVADATEIVPVTLCCVRLMFPTTEPLLSRSDSLSSLGGKLNSTSCCKVPSALNSHSTVRSTPSSQLSINRSSTTSDGTRSKRPSIFWATCLATRCRNRSRTRIAASALTCSRHSECIPHLSVPPRTSPYAGG